jgi:1-acyl-sn-glycerol-3-phosphate acyltransferase
VISWGLPIDRPENRLGVRLLGWTNLAMTRLYHHLTVLDPPCLPKAGPAILVCNHTSGLDPLLLQSCLNRLVIWLAAKEYYDVKSLAFVYRTIEAIPVERTGRDLAATRAALRTLQHGRILGIFPEGRIETSRELLPFQTGVALMAIKSGVAVYPAYLDGTQRGKEVGEAFVRPNHAVVSFGPPVQFNRAATRRDDLEAATEKIKDSINILATRVRTRL